MPFFNTDDIKPVESVPGFFGRFFNSENMTFAHYSVAAGESLREHTHESEEVLMVLDGEIEVTLNGETQVVGPRCVAVIPSNVPHALKMLTDTRFIAVDHPVRTTVGGKKVAA